jgi:isopentenyl-diphosphate delta-isomerase type 1
VAEELFDVVDMQDSVIATLPRSEVHRRKLLHRAVHVFVFRSDGAMLIHKRSATKEEFPSVWTSSCSGHVSAGETYDETAPREMFEELGIEAAVIPIRKFDACPETSHEFTMFYTANSDDPILPDAQEMTEIRWMKLAEIDEWTQRAPEDFSPAFLLLFKAFRGL